MEINAGTRWSSGCGLDCQVRGPRFKAGTEQKFVVLMKIMLTEIETRVMQGILSK